MAIYLPSNLNYPPTKQQVAALDFIEAMFGPDADRDNIQAMFVNAVAGAGKTTLIMLIAQALQEMEKQKGYAVEGCTLSFNRVIANQSKKKLTAIGSTLDPMTTNSLGNRILGRSDYPQTRIDTKKYTNLIKMHIEAEYAEVFGKFIPFKVTGAIRKLVSAARSTYTDATEASLKSIIAHYGLSKDIDISSEYWPIIWKSVQPVIEAGVSMYKKSGVIDFDDQIFLPLRLNLAAPMYDIIFVDEAQDLNSVRLQLIKRSVKSNGFLFFVGDPQQAIQGFAFADTNSVSTIKAETGAREFQLSVCWRCDERIVRVARELVPQIESRPNADPGTIQVVNGNAFLSMLNPGYKYGKDEKDPDLVLCRINAPLVANCLAAIREGKYAIVRGKSIGKDIIKLVDELAGVNKKRPSSKTSIGQLSEAAEDYRNRRVRALLEKDDSEQEIAELHDNVDTLQALLSGYLTEIDEDLTKASIEDLTKYIEDKFQGEEDEEEAQQDGLKPIVFSSVHKAKGLEYDRVFILRPDLFPHPAAKKDWQIEQEYNILYVAVTRAKRELAFVGGIPMPLYGIVTEILEEQNPEEQSPTAIIKIEPIQTEEIEEIAQPDPEEKAPKKKGRKATGRQTKLKQYSMDPHKVEAIAIAAKRRKNLGLKMENGRAIDESRLLDAIIASSPLYQLLIAENENAPTSDFLDDFEMDRAAAALDMGFPDDLYDGIDGIDFDWKAPKSAGDGAEDVFDGGMVELSEDDPESPLYSSESSKEVPYKTLRMFYKHKYGACKNIWTIDYYRKPSGEIFRIDAETGEVIDFDNDVARLCPVCSKRGTGKKLKAKHSSTHKCNATCQNAVANECTCSCGGENHGRAHMQGAPIYAGVLPGIVDDDDIES